MVDDDGGLGRERAGMGHHESHHGLGTGVGPGAGNNLGTRRRSGSRC